MLLSVFTVCCPSRAPHLQLPRGGGKLSVSQLSGNFFWNGIQCGFGSEGLDRREQEGFAMRFVWWFSKNSLISVSAQEQLAVCCQHSARIVVCSSHPLCTLTCSLSADGGRHGRVRNSQRLQLVVPVCGRTVLGSERLCRRDYNVFLFDCQLVFSCIALFDCSVSFSSARVFRLNP